MQPSEARKYYTYFQFLGTCVSVTTEKFHPRKLHTATGWIYLNSQDQEREVNLPHSRGTVSDFQQWLTFSPKILVVLWAPLNSLRVLTIKGAPHKSSCSVVYENNKHILPSPQFAIFWILNLEKATFQVGK